MSPGPVMAALILGAAILPKDAAAETRDGLRFTVNPRQYEGPETIEAKIARRQKEMDHLFRPICKGCGRHEGLTELDQGPFDPQRTLDGAKRR